jgi:hypothetical protein
MMKVSGFSDNSCNVTESSTRAFGVIWPDSKAAAVKSWT